MGQNGNGARPKLELELNESATVTLLRDKPVVDTSAFGEYHLFAVKHEGVEKSFFASAEPANQISTLELGAGDTITIQTVPLQVGKKVVSRLVLVVPTQEEKKKERNGDGLKDIMPRSLEEAVEITKSVTGIPFQNDDVRVICSCLFIARTKD